MSAPGQHRPAARRRASDADREAVIALLRSAMADGRLDVQELRERSASALRSKTFAELDALVEDLGAELTPPAVVQVTGGLGGTGVPATALGAIGADPSAGQRDPDTLVLTDGNPIRRAGGWQVPRRVVVRRRGQSAFLHLTRAELLSRDVEFDLDLSFGTVVIVLPRKAEISTDGLYAKGIARRPNVRIASGIRGSDSDPDTDLTIRLVGRMDMFSNVRLRWPSRGERRRLRRATSRSYSRRGQVSC